MPEFETILTDAKAQAFKHQGFWVDKLIIEFVDAAAARSPDKPAIVDSRGSCTFDELRNRWNMSCMS